MTSKEALIDLRFEMICLGWFPDFYNNDEELYKKWCEFSSEKYFAEELIIRYYYVREFKEWLENENNNKQKAN